MRIFTTEDGRQLPVDEDFLAPFLNPTSAGTHARESAPPGEVTDRQRGRMILQFHQVLHLMKEYGVDLGGKALLDIGTGNGMIPRLMLEFSGLAEAVGSDPFLDGEHSTSWQVHDHDSTFSDLCEYVERECGNKLDIDRYAAHLSYENYTMRPFPVEAIRRPGKAFSFAKLAADELGALARTFGLIYCKAIEHIQDWEGVLRNVSAVCEPDGVFYLKHRSFFSFLGAHRYASTAIPWGHVLLSENDYEKYAKEVHPEHASEMIRFYYEDLTHPRRTVSNLLEMAQAASFVPLAVICEPPRYIEAACSLISEVEDFWGLVRRQHHVATEELFSGIYHILLRRTSS